MRDAGGRECKLASAATPDLFCWRLCLTDFAGPPETMTWAGRTTRS